MIMLSKRLIDIREARNFTIEEVALSIGISRKTLGRYENGKSMPRLELLVDLADFYSVSIDYLLGKTDVADINDSLKGLNIVSDYEMSLIRKMREMSSDNRVRCEERIQALSESIR